MGLFHDGDPFPLHAGQSWAFKHVEETYYDRSGSTGTGIDESRWRWGKSSASMGWLRFYAVCSEKTRGFRTENRHTAEAEDKLLIYQ